MRSDHSTPSPDIIDVHQFVGGHRRYPPRPMAVGKWFATGRGFRKTTPDLPAPSMAKPITFTFSGETLQAQLESKIEKADLYGKSRMIVEKDGVILTKGTLLPTGELLRKEE